MATRQRTRRTQLSEPVHTQGAPGSPNGIVPPTPAVSANLQANLTASYISAGGYQYWSNFARSLPHPLDDLTQDLGIQIYRSMQFDGVIKAALTVLKASVLEDSVNLAPAIDDDGDPDATLAQQITDFCTWALDNLRTPLDAVLWDMMDCLSMGSRVAEQDYELQAVDGTQRLVLVDIRPTPIESTAFVVDAYNHLLGVVAVIPGVAYSLLQNSMMGDLDAAPNLLPRHKLAVLCFRPHNNDPRGTSILRSAYQAWWHKMQMWPEYLKFLTQFASPIPVGTTAEGAMPFVDPATGTVISPEQSQLAALMAIRNGAAISQPFGATIQLHFSQGAGDAFISAMDQDDRQMTVAILGQTLATGEGRHQARAAAAVHQDILATLIKQLKLFVVRMIRRDILAPLIRYNFGDDAADRLVPEVSLGIIENSDEAKMLAALSTAPGFEILPSQLQGVYDLVGLPQAEPDEITAMQEVKAAGQKAATELALNPPDPNVPATGKPPSKPADTVKGIAP